jgi:two-component system catabolic regulation response regulator CreB
MPHNPGSMTAHILLVEDDPAIARTVVYALQREGWSVTHCLLLQDAQSQLAQCTVQALVLDLELPDGNGLNLLRQLRLAGDTVAVLILSAQSEEIDRVVGLELGADDYLPKPFSPRELVARIKALLRRSQNLGARSPRPALTAALHGDEAGQRMVLHGTVLDLTRREYRLLSHLLRGVGRIYSRDQLLEAAWGDDSESTDRTVDTHVKTLRAKLRSIDPHHDYIETHRGMGYSLKLPPGA